MKIIILGAGRVGSTLAESLATEANDITLVDNDERKLQDIRDRFDVNTINGSGSHPQVMEKAGIQDADMLVAVTTHDEVNMVACQLAHSLYNTPHKIARIRSFGYTNDSVRDKLFGDQNMPVDVVITPEQLVTNHLQRLVRLPGALQVLDFAEGHLKLIGVRAAENAPMVGHAIKTIREHIPGIDCRIAAIYRKNTPIIPDGETIIEKGDEVFFLSDRKDIRKIMRELTNKERAYKRVIIAGGGNIGFRLAKTLEYEYQVKIIELDQDRCHYLAEKLRKTIVLNGSSSDQDLLLEEGIEDTDVYLALTNNDAANIMSSMLAKRLGTGKVVTLINSSVFVDLMQSSEIDIAVSPAQITTSALLTLVRKGDTVRAHSLRRGAAEVMEIVAHGDKRSSRVVGRRIDELALPEGAIVGSVVKYLNTEDKRSEVIVTMGHGDVVIEDNDHLIIFVTNKTHIRKVEQLFQVGISFF